ncbi:hypothetical protein PG999_014684 [Apiospora kogelbergensis]|uniref:Uncharacterized protein n=1 Tax=Apiospora kogelbergensis TaxID=1337665 RepID=A0AAW0Q2L8_9PEZI
MAANSRSALLGAHMKESKSQQLRPILTSLNGDNSWLISFPRPADRNPAAPKPSKAYYHVVWDPWFSTSGAAVTIASWVASVSLTAQSPIQNGDDIEQIAREIENKAADAGLIDAGLPGPSQDPMVDAIIITFHYADHLHETSLRKFDRRIPVVAAPEAAAILEKWEYFQSVTVMQDMVEEGPGWQALHPQGPLPEWLTIFRLRGEHELNFATAVVWSHESDAGEAGTTQERHEALWVSPHGMRMDQPALQAFLRDTTRTVDVLAMLHPLKESFTWGWQTVSGVTGGLAFERALKKSPKYWIPAADAVFSYWGLIMTRVFDVRRTLGWGLAEEERLAKEKGEAVTTRQPNLVQIGVGESLVLE